MQEKTNASVTERLVIERDHAHGQDGNCRDGEQVVFVLRQKHGSQIQSDRPNDIVYGLYSVESRFQVKFAAGG